MGIGGIAMGNLAIELHRQGYSIIGSDKSVYPPMLDKLRSTGIPFFEGYNATNLCESIECVIIGNSISKGNPELEEILKRKIPFFSLPEWIEKKHLLGKQNIVIAGTHGKTTTTAMIAWLLTKLGKNPSYFIGGFPQDFSSGVRFTDSEYTVLEGDEYDTAFFDKNPKFLHYLPKIIGIQSLEFDHLDIYSSLEEIFFQFSRFVELLPKDGKLFLNGDDSNCLRLQEKSKCTIETIGFSSHCTKKIEVKEKGGNHFFLNGEKYHLNQWGDFNFRNAAMAISIVQSLFPQESALCQLEDFKGVKRRQEISEFPKGIKFIDDFAHHPTAVSEILQSLKARFPDSRIRVIFQPSSYTSQSSYFQKDFSAALSLADEISLLEVKFKDHLPLSKRLNLQELVEDLQKKEKKSAKYLSAEALVENLFQEVKEKDIFCCLSNGGIQPLQVAFQAKFTNLF